MTAPRRAIPFAAAYARCFASVVAGVIAFSASAVAQGAPNPFRSRSSLRRNPRLRDPLRQKKAAPAPSAHKKSEPAKAATPPAAQTPAPDDPNVDLAYGAYQAGLYRTAFNIALKRAEEMGDPKSMTLLGELYSNALGIKRDDVKAAEWYKQAADRGDREAMFALGMMKISGRPPLHPIGTKVRGCSGVIR